MTSMHVPTHPTGLAAADLAPALDGSTVPVDAVRLAELLEEALALAPDEVSLRTSIADRLLERGCVRDARRHLRRALTLAPDDADTRCRLAAILVHEGEVPAALELYGSGRAAATGARLATEYADLLARLGLGREAASEYRTALEADGEYVPALVNLGVLHARRGDHGSAAACFDRAVAVDPTCAEATLNLANAYVELGRRDEAEELFLALEDDLGVRGAARLGRSAIATARGDGDLAASLRTEAVLADPALADLCDLPGA